MTFKGIVIEAYKDKVCIKAEESQKEYTAKVEQSLSLKIGDQVSFEIDKDGKFSPKTKRRYAKNVALIELSNVIPFPVSSNAEGTCSKTEDVALIEEKKAQHFVVVFNPLLNNPEDTQHEKFPKGTQGHWFYNLLKHNLKSQTADYSYWGKIKSGYVDDLNLDDYKNVIKENESIGKPTHLYITDFTFMWVANIERVQDEISDHELNKTLYFYKKNKSKVEVWFKITDIALLSSTAKETGTHLENLEVPKLKIKKLNPYLCNLRYPLVVKETIGLDYFTSLKEGEKYINRYENPLSENTDLESKIVYSVISYAIPNFYFSKIPVMAKSEIIMAEALNIDRDNPRGKFLEMSRENQIFLHYAKAIEIILFHLLLKEGLAKDCNFSSFLHAIKNNDDSILCTEIEAKRLRKETHSKVDFLYRVKNLRNALTHPDETSGQIIDLEKRLILHFRSIMLGVGCNGYLNEIYRTYLGRELTAPFVTSLAEFLTSEQDYNYKKGA